MLPLADAVRRVMAGAAPLPTERVALPDALGRVLAERVAAPTELPPWDNAAMDGYAVRAADVARASEGAPVALPVLETVAAGDLPTRRVEAGTATRIMTGAPMPDGADSVVRVEDTDGGVERVTVRSARDAGRNVRPRGEDVTAGTVPVPPGTPLDGAQLALLAAIGATAVAVHRRPRVALLSSGDELVPLERAREAADGRRIVASNSVALAALLRRDGAEPVDLGLAADDPDAIAERARAAAGCDLLVTTAGASVGEFDYTRRALERLGLALDFWRAAVRPGSQTAFGRLEALGGMPWLGLPGNPVSAQVTYELFVRPLVLRWSGHTHPFRRTIAVTLDEPLRAPGSVTFLPRVTLRLEAGAWRARLAGAQGTGLLSSMSAADALLVVPQGTTDVAAGDRLQALLLRDLPLHAEAAGW